MYFSYKMATATTVDTMMYL